MYLEAFIRAGTFIDLMWYLQGKIDRDNLLSLREKEDP